MTRLPFWSDDFDADLLAVVPDVAPLLAIPGDRPLYVHNHTHPSARGRPESVDAAIYDMRETLCSLRSLLITSEVPLD